MLAFGAEHHQRRHREGADHVAEVAFGQALQDRQQRGHTHRIAKPAQEPAHHAAEHAAVRTAKPAPARHGLADHGFDEVGAEPHQRAVQLLARERAEQAELPLRIGRDEGGLVDEADPADAVCAVLAQVLHDHQGAHRVSGEQRAFDHQPLDHQRDIAGHRLQGRACVGGSARAVAAHVECVDAVRACQALYGCVPVVAASAQTVDQQHRAADTGDLDRDRGAIGTDQLGALRHGAR